jgi:hypothetical protein
MGVCWFAVKDAGGIAAKPFGRNWKQAPHVLRPRIYAVANIIGVAVGLIIHLPGRDQTFSDGPGTLFPDLIIPRYHLDLPALSVVRRGG